MSSEPYTPEPCTPAVAVIKVAGVGGGGCNALARMFHDRIEGVEYIALNTDAQGLGRCEIPKRMRIGEKLTRGLGVGGNPELGKQAAEESRDDIAEALKGSDMVFIAAGMGGGTGTGAAPVVAEVAKEQGALTIAVVTKPFSFEGARRRRNADEGLLKLRDKVDTLIAIPNDRLFTVCDQKVTVDNAFRIADEVLRQGVQAIAELVTIPGEINLDFADVKAIMKNSGPAWMAIGRGRGEKKAMEAARNAIASPLLDVTIDGAKGVLFKITGNSSLTLADVQQAAQVISEVVDPDANIIFGMVTDPDMGEDVSVTIIATGFSAASDLASRDDSVSKLLMEAFDEKIDLDIPPFLRRNIGSRRRNHSPS